MGVCVGYTVTPAAAAVVKDTEEERKIKNSQWETEHTPYASHNRIE